MQKNIAGQKLSFLMWDDVLDIPKIGDDANITVYQTIDGGAIDTLAGVIAEVSAGNMPGIYTIELTTAQTNGNDICFYPTSIPADVSGIPAFVATVSADIALEANATINTAAIIAAITALAPAVIPLVPATVTLDNIKILLQIEGTDKDAIITLLMPIIEDITCKYCGVATIADFSQGVVFPIAGLIRYAMENPIGAVSATVGGDSTNYGTFPNSLLKLLDVFKPDSIGGFANAEVINLTDINTDLGR